MKKQSFKDVVQYIKDNVDIVEVISKYIHLQIKGNKWWGLSPFKSEKTPSFCVDGNKNLYYCFSTSQGGDVFTFVQEIEHTDFKGAVHVIARDMSIDIDIHSNEYKDDTTQRILEVCTRISKTFQYLLHKKEGKQALAYMKQRGFSEEILETFHIGYAPFDDKWLYNFLHSKGYTSDELIDTGLFSKNYENYPLFRDRVIFPIMSISGQIVAFGGRQLSDKGPKYINSPETKFYQKKKLLYGLFQCMKSKGFTSHKKAYLVEGYLDVIALHQVGYNNAVAPLGTAFSTLQAEILMRACDSIVMMFDNDDAGLHAAFKSAIICEQVGFKNISMVVLEGNDPAAVLEKEGMDSLQKQILEEQEFFDYYINKMFPGNNASIQEKEHVITHLLEYVSVIDSEYKRIMYSTKIADVFSVATDIVERLLIKKRQTYLDTASPYARKNQPVYREDIAHNTNTTNPNTINTSSNEYIPTQNIPPIIKNRELLTMVAVCTLAVEDISYFKTFRTHVMYKDLDDYHARNIFAILEKLYRKHTLQMYEILSSLEYPLQQYIQQLIASGEATTNAKNIFEDFLFFVKINRLKKRSKAIEYELRIKSNNTNTNIYPHIITEEEDGNTITELLHEKKFINNEIIRLKNE